MPHIQLDTADIADTLTAARTPGCIRLVDLGTHRPIEFGSDIDLALDTDSLLCIVSVLGIGSDLGTELAVGQLVALAAARTSCRTCTRLDWR